jgi:hypothetical protein
MGRRKIENRKVNKSGRFDPDLLEQIEQLASRVSMKNFSQTLEFLAKIGIAVTSEDIYGKINSAAAADRMDYEMKVREIVRAAVLNH